MPRRSPRRPNGFFDDREMEWSLSQTNRIRLENTLGSKLNETSFGELCSIVRFYIFSILNDGGQTWDSHLSHMSKIIFCAERLKGLLEHTEQPEISVAANSDLNSEFAENVDLNVLIVPRYRVFAEMPEYQDYVQNGTYPLTEYVSENAIPPLQQGISLIALQISDIVRMLSALQKAAIRVCEDYKEQASAIVTRENAFDEFLRDIKEWAQRHKLKTSTIRKDQSAGPLACFIFELEGMLPKKFRQHPASAEAVAKRLQRAKRTTAGQERRRLKK